MDLELDSTVSSPFANYIPSEYVIKVCFGQCTYPPQKVDFSWHEMLNDMIWHDVSIHFRGFAFPHRANDRDWIRNPHPVRLLRPWAHWGRGNNASNFTPICRFVIHNLIFGWICRVTCMYVTEIILVCSVHYISLQAYLNDFDVPRKKKGLQVDVQPILGDSKHRLICNPIRCRSKRPLGSEKPAGHVRWMQVVYLISKKHEVTQ